MEKFVLRFRIHSSINNKSTLVQVMILYWTGDKLLPEPLLTQSTDTYMLH